MKYLRLILGLFLTFWLTVVTTTAQPIPSWTQIQDCAAEPIAPPDDWRFDGVIVTAYPEDGVRGLRAETFQTYYISFAGSNFIKGGALSPSGIWYAVPYGYIQTAAAFDVRYEVNELRIYSTAAYPQIRARLAWKAEFQLDALTPIVWLDDETFSFPQGSFLGDLASQIVKPFTGEVTSSPYADYISLSPDLTRGFRLQEDRWGLFEVETDTPLAWFSALANDTQWFRWSADSQHFAVTQDNGESRWLTLINREGEVLERVSDITTERRLWNFGWSPDSAKFVFSAYDPYKDENWLYLGDMASRVVTDTCVSLINQHNGDWLSGAVWSADGTHLALVTNGSFEDPNALQILEVASETRYGIGVYSGGLIGWGKE